ncbi:ComEC/Rec2 family competence protein [Paenibacillus alginolyticus]|uniref:MBL fold metallo-hydrolase n=2 Tax=Paenibacillus alginolyticus TaxID=59839 RepID=A0ABT4GDT2_9BACL|nr:MBL fold metallo-hydrolase [Paenibacillus alginolyticus]MCY9694349.1 MBL fold metallo-hydrolase [Paenibacillus alginolyticus]
MAELTVIFLDSGQGDCTLIVYPDGSLTLVDCGSIKNGNIVSSSINEVLNTYISKNNYRINNFVLTHPDQDHYNLLKNFSSSINIDQIYYGGDLDLYRNGIENNATYNFLNNHLNCTPPPNSYGGAAPDAKLSRAGVNVYILAANCTGNPQGNTSEIKNSNSIVLLVEYLDVKIFLMGDATFTTENFILNQCQQANLNGLLTNNSQTVLKMGHHGSAGSTGKDWVEAITPNTIFLSADTRTFSGTGMPAASHLNNVAAWSGHIDNQAISHNYVQFVDNVHSVDYQTFEQVGPTTYQVCSTLYGIKYLNPSKTLFESIGGSWYYYVTDTREIYFGFTG